ncbi:hypothetical protein RRG08_008014 [Elysia crispata]|uniref:Uncharacterized protein n=1 Tax=Elysia crispata TaxID=231223 RepID=A0AAE0YRL1_9GAST|nr:hypothetical protein RRG08_008014 [Elysia crispata]
MVSSFSKTGQPFAWSIIFFIVLGYQSICQGFASLPQESGVNGSQMTRDSLNTTGYPFTASSPASTPSPGAHLPHDLKRSVYVLDLTLDGSNGSSSDIVVTEPEANHTAILMELKVYLETVASGVYLHSDKAAGMEDSFPLVLRLEFTHGALDEDLQAKLEDALAQLDSSGMFSVESNTSTMLENFFMSTQDPCTAMFVCPLGFTCNSVGCQHMCIKDDVCNGRGDCVVSVLSNGDAAPTCRCHSGYTVHYSGDQCQDKRMGDGQATAIVAGILGSICLLLLVAVLVLCMGRKSSSNYMLSKDVYSKSTYANTETRG